SAATLLVGWLAWMPSAQAQPTKTPYEDTVRPVLAKYCVACHNEKLNTAGLNLDAIRDSVQAAKAGPVWDKVLEKITAGKMPPVGLPSPSKSEASAVTTWIESLQDRARRDADPGRVTARRLNRVEYNNTVRDLLGVALRPADEFPVDDSGYGFDNIGDVLSVSPLLMEKYMNSAKRLS